MYFVGAGIGIVFIVLGLFLVIVSFRRRQDRERLLYSGFGAVCVGIGNIMMPIDALVGIAGLVIGVFLIFFAARASRRA